MVKRHPFNNAAKARPPQMVLGRLFKAAQQGDVKAIKDTLASNPEALECHLHGKTALQVAVEKNQMQSVQALLEAGASPNARSGDGNASPFIAAVQADNTLMMITLLHKGAEVNPQSPFARQPLQAAIETESVKAIRLLVAHGAALGKFNDDGNAPLHAALAAKKLKAAEALIESGADINQRNRGGYTALMQAAEENNLAAAKFLMEREAALDPVSDLSETAHDIARAFPGKDGRFLRAFEQALFERLKRETREYLPEFRKGTSHELKVKRPAKFRPK